MGRALLPSPQPPAHPQSTSHEQGMSLPPAPLRLGVLLVAAQPSPSSLKPSHHLVRLGYEDEIFHVRCPVQCGYMAVRRSVWLPSRLNSPLILCNRCCFIFQQPFTGLDPLPPVLCLFWEESLLPGKCQGSVPPRPFLGAARPPRWSWRPSTQRVSTQNNSPDDQRPPSTWDLACINHESSVAAFQVCLTIVCMK